LDIAKALKGLLEQLRQGLKIRAINLSMGDMIPGALLKQRLGIPESLSLQQQLGEWRADVVERLRRFALQHPNTKISPLEDKTTEALLEGIDALSTIYRDHGVPAFVAAGNDGPEHLNVYLLAEGAQGVGALDARGQKWPQSGDNALVGHWAPGEALVAIDGQPEQVGPGTSFATPTALAGVLRASVAQ
jgi:hypothetical protein